MGLTSGIRFAALAALLLSGAGLAAVPESGGAEPVVASAPVGSTWMPAILDEIRRSEYHFSRLPDGTWSAPNRARNLRASLGKSGLTLVPRTGDAVGRSPSLSLRPVRYGRREHLFDLPPVPATAGGNRAEYRRANGTLLEWYVNDERGLEQGFTLLTPPPGDRAGSPIVIEMAFPEELSARLADDGRTALFSRRDGSPVVRYGDLEAWDASGLVRHARLRAGTGTLLIEVEDEGAVYPITIDPLLTTDDWTTEGDQNDARHGFSVAMGRFNNDTYMDLVVGAYLYDSGSLDEGKVFVYYGTASVPPTIPDWTAESNQAGAQFGFAVAVGRLGNDPFSDLIVGAPSYDTVVGDNRGRVFVFYGSLTGLGDPGTPLNADWSADHGQSNSEFGYSVAAGDVNGGIDDLLVGCPRYTNGSPNEGRAFLYLAGLGGLPLPAAPNWAAESNFAQARLGHAVAWAGNVNGGIGGIGDAVIGAPQYGPALGDNRGRAFVWYGGGGAGGLGPLLPAIDHVGTADWAADSGQPGAQFGSSVASAGDVDNNGLDEVIVGAPLQDTGGGLVDDGHAYVYFGGGIGLSPVASWSARGEQSNARLGAVVASIVDAGGPGFDGVAAGAPLYDDLPGDNRGAAFLWQGSLGGLGPPGDPDNAHWAAEGSVPNAGFGISLASGDVNGDAQADLLVGAETWSDGEPAEGAAFLYLAFTPPAFLEFGPMGDARRIEATGAVYTSITGLAGGEYSLTGSAVVKMGNCALAPDCTRLFSFMDLTAVNDPADLSSTGAPAFRIVGGTTTVDTAASPIRFPGVSDLTLDLGTFTLGAAGADVVPGGMLWTLPARLTSDLGPMLPIPFGFPIEQDLDFDVTYDPGSVALMPLDYPFVIPPLPGSLYHATRQRVELGLSGYAYVDKERGTAGFGGTGCAVPGACIDDSNDEIFSFVWTFNEYPAGGAPAGSVAVPYVERDGLRATLVLTADGTYTPLFPAGTFVFLDAGSRIEVIGTEPSGGYLSGGVALTMWRGSIDPSEADGDCSDSGMNIFTSFINGTLLPGGELRVSSLSPIAPLPDLSWGGTGPGELVRGFFVGDLQDEHLSFYGPGTLALVDPAGPRESVQEHLLAEQDDGTGAGVYAGVNVSHLAEAGTVGLDSDCPEPAPGGHSFSVGSSDTRLYVRASGVSGVVDGGNLDPPQPFNYMGYDLTLSNFAASFLDNQVRTSGVVVNRVLIPQPSDIELLFSSPAEINGCASFTGSMGEMANAGDEQTLLCWEADFTPSAAYFALADADTCLGERPPATCCLGERPAGCNSLLEDAVRYLHVSSTAPFELDPGHPGPARFRDEVPMDFTPGPTGPMVCSDIVPAGDSGSVRNELEPGFGFGVDLTHASLLPSNPTCPAAAGGPTVLDLDPDEPRYEVLGETLFPFFGGTMGCAAVKRDGTVEIRGGCAGGAEPMEVSRRVMAGLFELEFKLEYYDPLRTAATEYEKTASRFMAKSARLDLELFDLPVSVKLFGSTPALDPDGPGGEPEVPEEAEHPELYLGFLSDLAAYAEARGNDLSCNPGSACHDKLESLLPNDPNLPGNDLDFLEPGLEAYYDDLKAEGIRNIRSLVAETMKETVGDLLPADFLRAAERTKAVVDDLWDGAGGFDLGNFTGPGRFAPAPDLEAPDWILENIHVDADVDLASFMDFQGYVDLNTHTANTIDDEDDTADVTVGANDVGIDWVIDGARAKTIQGTLFFDPSPSFQITGISGEIVVTGLEFGEVEVDEFGLFMGMGDGGPLPDDDFYYIAATARGRYKSVSAEAGFFLGKSIDLEPLLMVDPDVGEALEGIDSLTGVYARVGGSVPIVSGPDCYPYNLTVGGANAYWLFAEGPTFGAKMRSYAHGSIVCVVTARADMTLLGGLRDEVWHLSGYGFMAGGVGLCEPEDWDSRRDVLNDSWCFACVLDGEFSTDSERDDFQGDFDGPDCD